MVAEHISSGEVLIIKTDELLAKCVFSFLYLQVPLYMVAQLLGSLLASGTLSLLFSVTDEAYFGTIPVGPDIRSFVTEIIISFLLMFVISGVATDNRAVSYS